MLHRFRKRSGTRDGDCTGRRSTSRTDAKAAWVDENRLATDWDLCYHYSCPSELYRPTSLPMKNWNTAKYVHAVYRDTRRKSANIDVSGLLFHIFRDIKKTETSFLISNDRVDTWVCHFTPQTQQVGVRWKHPASPIVSVIWDAERVTYVEYMPRCRSGNVNASWDRLLRLSEAWVGRDLDISREVWSCSEVIQHHTTHVGQRSCCSRLTWNFWTIYWSWPCPVGLMCAGCWSRMHSKQVEWLFLKGYKCKIRFLRTGNF